MVGALDGWMDGRMDGRCAGSSRAGGGRWMPAALSWGQLRRLSWLVAAGSSWPLLQRKQEVSVHTRSAGARQV